MLLFTFNFNAFIYFKPSLEFLDLEKNDNEVNDEKASSIIGL